MARPRKADAAKRTEQIGVRFTPDERAVIERAAARAGVSFAEYVRMQALHVPVAVRQTRTLDWPAMDQLRRIGINLNQAVRVANTHGRIPPALESAAAAFERFLSQEIEGHGPEGRR